MSIAFEDAEGKKIDFPHAPIRRSTVPKESPPDKPLDGPTTKTEVTRALCVTYNLVHRIIHDDERFTPSDFAEEADGIMALLEQHAHLRVIMRIVAPIAAIGAIIEKAEGTISRFRDRRQSQKEQKAKVAAQQATSPTAPVDVQSTPPVETPGVITPEAVRGRSPFARR